MSGLRANGWHLGHAGRGADNGAIHQIFEYNGRSEVITGATVEAER